MRGVRLDVVLVVLMMVLGARSADALAADPFEGKWKITLTPDTPGQPTIEDTLTFRALRFTSDAFTKLGFGTVEYEEGTSRYGPATFTATMISDKAGAAKWEGTAVTSQLTGTVTWTKKDGTVLSYSFKGSRAP